MKVTIGTALVGNKTLKRRVKIAAAKEEMTINDLIFAAVIAWLDSNGY